MAFALSYASKNVTTARSELGLLSDKSWAVGDATLALRGRAAWAHDYNTNRNRRRDVPVAPWRQLCCEWGSTSVRDSALATASSEMTFSSGISIAATYEGEFSSVTRSHAGKGVVRYVW